MTARSHSLRLTWHAAWASAWAPVWQAWQRIQNVDSRLSDWLLALALCAVALVQFSARDPHDLWRVPSVLGTTLSLAWRRRAALRCHLLQILFAILGLQQPVSATLVALFVGLYSVAVYSRWRLSMLLPVIEAATLAFFVPNSYQWMPAWAVELVAGLGVWLAGHAVRTHQTQASALAERARRLEREQELAMRVAVADERARIARELHDVVAHSVSVMVVQAGAARTMVGRQPERAAEALLSVEASGREALAELRRMLGLLTEQGGDAALSPQPGLAQLDALVERVEQAGLPVHVRLEGSPRPLPPGLDLTAYRIVQEALTNALKHAGGAPTEVRLRFDDHDLRLEVLDAGGTAPAGPVGSAGAGRGLLGMRERVAVFGGALEAGPRPEGGFAVRARLPLQPA